jgi:hypothetical protein
MPGPTEDKSQDDTRPSLHDLSFNDRVRDVLVKVDTACASGEEVRLSPNEATILLRHIEISKVAVRATRRIMQERFNPPSTPNEAEDQDK